MKQRSMILAAVAMIPFAVAAAQTPPTPPVTPVTPTPATPVVPAPLPVQTPLIPLYPDFIDREEIRRISEDARRQGQLAAEEGRRMAEEGRRIAEEAKWQAQVAMKDLKLDHKFDFDFDFKFDQKFDFDFKFDGPKLAHLAQGLDYYMPAPAGQGMLPGQQRFQEPADSAWEVAWQAFTRQDYSRAASRFADLIAKFPNSRRAAQAPYYQAFALYRIGTLESLRQALKVIENNQPRLAYVRSGDDTPALHARILRALADRNESGAEAKLKDLYARYPATTCDQEMVGIQSQVLNSYYQSDPEAALPAIRAALAKRDPCSAEIRKTAVVLLANRPTEEKAAILISVAKNDTVREVRTRAIDMLARMPGDAAMNALGELMRDNDEYIQRAAVRSLMRSDNVRARNTIKTSIVARRDAPESQRVEAIRSFERDNMTEEDAVFLRNLFNQQNESDRVKDAILGVIASVPTEANIKFLLDVAKNPNESSQLRSRALRTVTRTTLSTEELIKIYDATDSRSMRQSLVEGLSNRREDAALNKLLEIAKCSTDPEVRKYTIQVLLNKNDKVVTERVLNLISGTGGPKC